MGIFGLYGKRLEPKELLWQRHQECSLVSFGTDIYGAKFQEQRALIFPEISFIQFLPLCGCSSITSSLILFA